MLPDFPDEKSLCNEILQRRMCKVGKQRLGPFSGAPERGIHEGRAMRIEREDGGVDESDYAHVSASFSLSSTEATQLTVPQLLEKLDNAAVEIAEQKLKHIFQSLDRAVESVGNTFQHSQDNYVEGYLHALDTIWLDFDEDGSPQLPSLVGGKDAADGLTRAIQAIKGDPELSKRRDAIIERQREKWRARESDRKLVG